MKCTRLLIVFILLLASVTCINAQYPGSGTGTYSGGSINSNGPSTTSDENLDSLERSPLSILRRSIGNPTQKEVIDTNNHYQLQLVEPYYRQEFVGSNLGSENSASFPAKYLDYNRIGVELGHFQYKTLLDSLGLNEVYDVNRSLWSIYYGKGYGIPSDNLNVDFYKRFNRDILINFSYDNYKDISLLGNQSNRVRNMDLKLYQDNNRGRVSYILFSNTNVEETNSRTLSAEENSDSQLKQLRYQIGNRMLLKDSLLNGKLFINSVIGYKNEFYSFSDNALVDSEIEYYQPLVGVSSLDYRNELATFKVGNELVLDKGRENASIGIDYLYKKQSLLQDTFSYNEVQLKFQYSKNIFSQSHFRGTVSYGLFDASNDIDVGLNLATPFKIGSNEISINMASQSPTLLHRYLSTSQGIVWQNDYKKTNRIIVKANQFWNAISLNTGLEISYFINPTLFNQNSESEQLDISITSLAFKLQKDINWKFLKSKHSVLLQNINSVFIATPNIQLNGQLSTKFSLFKKKLNSTVGFNYIFMPSYSVSSYNPSIGVFYNDLSGARSGNVILINPYYSFRVDQFNFFVKCNNCLSRAIGSDLQLIRDYNLYDFRIVAGIKWRLLD